MQKRIRLKNGCELIETDTSDMRVEIKGNGDRIIFYDELPLIPSPYAQKVYYKIDGRFDLVWNKLANRYFDLEPDFTIDESDILEVIEEKEK